MKILTIKELKSILEEEGLPHDQIIEILERFRMSDGERLFTIQEVKDRFEESLHMVESRKFNDALSVILPYLGEGESNDIPQTN